MKQKRECAGNHKSREGPQVATGAGDERRCCRETLLVKDVFSNGTGAADWGFTTLWFVKLGVRALWPTKRYAIRVPWCAHVLWREMGKFRGIWLVRLTGWQSILTGERLF